MKDLEIELDTLIEKVDEKLFYCKEIEDFGEQYKFFKEIKISLLTLKQLLNTKIRFRDEDANLLKDYWKGE